MLPHKPLFTVGDAVCEKFPSADTSRGRGIVTEGYELEDQYRYVVKFESGREGVFFERELVADHNKPA